MDNEPLRKGLEANRLFHAANTLPSSAAPVDVDHLQRLLSQVIDLQVCKCLELSQSSEPCENLGCAQAAQALGNYHAES